MIFPENMIICFCEFPVTTGQLEPFTVTLWPQSAASPIQCSVSGGPLRFSFYKAPVLSSPPSLCLPIGGFPALPYVPADLQQGPYVLPRISVRCLSGALGTSGEAICAQAWHRARPWQLSDWWRDHSLILPLPQTHYSVLS